MPGTEFKIAIDAASTEWYRDDGTYFMPKKRRSSQETS